MLTLYVNGDSHAAAAECVNQYGWALDDGLYWALGKQAHPDNARASFGCELANQLRAILELQAQAGGSNSRIIRTTRDWLNQQHSVSDVFVLIQWSTWEREEWFHNNEWWQVNSSGVDQVPDELQDRYRKFVADVDWPTVTQRAHQTIWQFHQELKQQGIKHLFFNGNNHFGSVQDRVDWGHNYIAPYDSQQTYHSVLKNNGFDTVSPESWHFGSDAHCFWADYVLQYNNTNNLLSAQ